MDSHFDGPGNLAMKSIERGISKVSTNGENHLFHIAVGDYTGARKIDVTRNYESTNTTNCRVEPVWAASTFGRVAMVDNGRIPVNQMDMLRVDTQ